MTGGSGRPRHILWLCADQLRADSLACYGNPVVATPHIDLLAREGTRFARHYACAAPCSPARASLLTGLYQFTHRVTGNRTPFDPAIPNIAHAVDAVGMPAHLIGYTDTVTPPYLADAEGVMPGFRVHTYFNLTPNGLTSWFDELAKRRYGRFESADEAFRPVETTVNEACYAAEDSDTAYLADRVIDCIKEHAAEPWLILAAFLRPHPPWVAPEPYRSMYSPRSVWLAKRAGTPQEEARTHQYLTEHLRRQGLLDAPVPVETALHADALGWNRATHLALVTELDHHVGRILAALESLSMADDTVVVFTSDHGAMLGDHWLSGSGGYYEGTYHVPLVIREPRRRSAASGVVVGLTESVDLVPTILDIVGAAPLPWADGQSLVPQLRSPTEPLRRRGVLAEYDFRHEPEWSADLLDEERVLCIWRTSRHKYVHFAGLPPLLFDTVEDPHELVDLSTRTESSETVCRLAQDLLSHRLSHADQTRPRRSV
jgi:arylsulfatase A-like enzyme